MNKALTHEQIEKNLIIDRYVLGQLSEEEQQLFEAHFTECVPCMDQIEVAEAFQRDYQRAVQTGAIAPPTRRRAFHPQLWMGLAMAALLLIFLGSNLFKSAETVSWNLSGDVLRGAEIRTYKRPANDVRVVLQIQVKAPYYRAELRDATGHSLAISQGQGAHIVELPPTELKEGRYQVDLEISTDGEHYTYEGEYPFQVETTTTH